MEQWNKPAEQGTGALWLGAEGSVAFPREGGIIRMFPAALL